MVFVSLAIINSLQWWRRFLFGGRIFSTPSARASAAIIVEVHVYRGLLVDCRRRRRRRRPCGCGFRGVLVGLVFVALAFVATITVATVVTTAAAASAGTVGRCHSVLN